MLTNLVRTEHLGPLFRHRRSRSETKTVDHASVQEQTAAGWKIDRENKKSVRLSRAKPAQPLLVDRIWSLLYRLSFEHLSEEQGASLRSDSGSSSEYQFEIVGLDDEVALGIRAHAIDQPARWRGLDRVLTEMSEIAAQFEEAVHAQFSQRYKRQVALLLFTSNVHVTPAQRRKAEESGVVLFDEKDLEYYEKLTSHIDAAAKYQLFADVLPGRSIPGLSLRIPAIRARIGDFYCYTFSISPAYLLKIAYVSHRSKGKASDVVTYQRMLTKDRLNKIRSYISEDGIFPTNIVLNLESRQLQFEAIQQQHSGDPDGGVLGLLAIDPAYKSAWIIDGQHRLFAYSGHDSATTGRLAVLAFEGLPSSMQAKLFIDINAKQKKVKQALLQELYADLKWDADEPSARTAAIISKSVQELGADPESPFYGRIQTTDAAKNETTCISLPSVFRPLERSGFFIAEERNGVVMEYGALGSPDTYLSLQRTVHALKEWFELIRKRVPDWWDLGSAPGGGLAMNDGVTACINVLRSVYQHLELQGLRLSEMNEEALASAVEPFGNAVGEYLASLSDQDRKRFRDLRGNQGLTTRTRRLQQAIRQVIPGFVPQGLEDFLDHERKQTNDQAKEIIDRLESALQSLIVSELKREYGPDESEWWNQGVNKEIRKRLAVLYEEDDRRRGTQAAYFNLIDYRTIGLANWTLFEPFLGYGSGNKEKKTAWLSHVNDCRRIVSHASSGKTVSLEELAQLEEYERWFFERLKGKDSNSQDETDLNNKEVS